jgi:hypothetical protein
MNFGSSTGDGLTPQMTSDLIIAPTYGEYFLTSEYSTITRCNYRSDVKVHRDGARTTQPVLFHCQLE